MEGDNAGGPAGVTEGDTGTATEAVGEAVVVAVGETAVEEGDRPGEVVVVTEGVPEVVTAGDEVVVEVVTGVEVAGAPVVAVVGPVGVGLAVWVQAARVRTPIRTTTATRVSIRLPGCDFNRLMLSSFNYVNK